MPVQRWQWHANDRCVTDDVDAVNDVPQTLTQCDTTRSKQLPFALVPGFASKLKTPLFPRIYNSLITCWVIQLTSTLQSILRQQVAAILWRMIANKHRYNLLEQWIGLECNQFDIQNENQPYDQNKLRTGVFRSPISHSHINPKGCNEFRQNIIVNIITIISYRFPYRLVDGNAIFQSKNDYYLLFPGIINDFLGQHSISILFGLVVMIKRENNNNKK